MNPLLLDISLQFETEKLILRVPRQSVDSSIVNVAIRDSFNELKPWLPLHNQFQLLEKQK